MHHGRNICQISIRLTHIEIPNTANPKKRLTRRDSVWASHGAVHFDCPDRGTNAAVHFAAHSTVVDVLVHGDEQALELLLALMEHFQSDNIAAGRDSIAGLARVGINVALEEHVCPLHSSTREGPSPAEHTGTDRPSPSTQRRACNEGLPARGSSPVTVI